MASAATSRSSSRAIRPRPGRPGRPVSTNTITTFGRKAFRRPLTDHRGDELHAVQQPDADRDANEVAEAILYAFLASPSFIALPELGQTTDTATGAFKLTSYEVATRLSFLLWNSVPDDTLNTAADSRPAHHGRADPRAGAADAPEPQGRGGREHLPSGLRAHRERLALDEQHHAHDRSRASPSATYTAAMAELDAFFAGRGGQRRHVQATSSPAPNGFVTKDTAPIYGVTSTATTPTKMALDATKRPGFLTRVGFLSTFAHDATSSPILRGAFITRRVLAIPVGTPDPTFLGMTPPAGNYTTNRQAMEALTRASPCNALPHHQGQPAGLRAGEIQRRRRLAGQGSARRRHQLDRGRHPQHRPRR